MDTNIKIKLTSEQSDILSQFPEQGMGYQIVDIKLKNGHLLKEKIVLNGIYLQVKAGELLKPSDIETIKIHSK